MLYKTLLVFVVVFFEVHKTEETTKDIFERIKILKNKLTADIKKQIRIAPIRSGVIKNENYDYVDIENLPVTPIMSNDARQYSERYRQKIVSTPRSTLPNAGWSPRPTGKNVFNNIVSSFKANNAPYYEATPEVRYPAITPLETFYRKRYRKMMSKEQMNKQMPWVHCQPLLTPYVLGLKEKVTEVSIKEDDDGVIRFINILTSNVTMFTKDDVYALMYEINNMQILLFQWSSEAIRLLINAISSRSHSKFAECGWKDDKPGCKMSDKGRSFDVLKTGLMKIFRTWGLDLRNTTNLIRQAKVFRPYCFLIGYSGSTKAFETTTIKLPTTTVYDSCDID